MERPTTPAMARLLCITALLAGDVALAARTTPRRLAKLGHASLATVPMRMFKQDCHLERPIAGLIQNPGAGMDPTWGPTKQVLKDGYFHVECVKDYMFLHGDKHGDNKFSYELGEISNVSIVHYSLQVAKEDRQPMSHDTCFAFCRTVPEMLFFGITNGRECYCAPYYKPMASDSSDCDAVCEGETTTMCGGKTKSSIFEMHGCMSTGQDLSDAQTKMNDVLSQMVEVSTELLTIKDILQTAGDGLKGLFGEAGNPTAAGLMQTTVNFAGVLESSLKKAQDLEAKAGGLLGSAAKFDGSANWEAASTVTEAEGVISEMEQFTADTEAMTEELQTLKAMAAASSNTTGALDQYYEGMYFVDSNKTQLPSTCGGDLAAAPMLATAEECAAACDKVRAGQGYGGSLLEIHSHSQSAELNARVGGCVGFSIFETTFGQNDYPQDLCFLFSKLTSLTYYSQCGATPVAPLTPDFLQKTKALPHGTACMAKLQYFEGTTLAPDASGKCKKCLKKVDHAERCPSHLLKF